MGIAVALAPRSTSLALTLEGTEVSGTVDGPMGTTEFGGRP